MTKDRKVIRAKGKPADDGLFARHFYRFEELYETGSERFIER